MRYLGLALYAEGRHDYYFLRPLLQRLCEDICGSEADEVVEINEVLSLDHPGSVKDEIRAVRIVEAAKEARGAWNILFIHADGAGDSVRARLEQVDPALELIRNEFLGVGVGVAVIPIKETEAWAVLDGDAIRQTLGVSLSDGELGLPPTPRLAEGVSDPKAVLEKACNAMLSPRRRGSVGASPYLGALGERVSLNKLRKTQAFSQLEKDLRHALRELGFLRA